MSVPDYANYTGLRLWLKPKVQGSNLYVLELANVGDVDLWHLRVELEDVTGPGAFRLDDTHMRRDLHSERVELPTLRAGQREDLRRAPRSSIAGAKASDVRVYVSFSALEDGDARFGVRVPVQEVADAR